MSRVLRRIVPILPFLLVVSCADSERSAFDPDADRTPPELVDFEITTQDQIVYALWSASEPVHVVVEYYDPIGLTNHHSYPPGREFAPAGITKLIGVESGTEYRMMGVRLRDRAGNETFAVPAAAPSFTTGVVAPQDLLYFAMVDVGWGDALYLETPPPDGKRVLVDAGHPMDAPRVWDFLQRHGIAEVDFASMTHVHEDHIGGFYGDDFDDIDGLLQNNGGGTTPLRVGTFLDILDKTPGTINGPYGSLQAALRGLQNAGRLDEHVFLKTGASSSTEESLRWGSEVRVDLLAAGRKDFLLPDHILVEEAGSVRNNDSMVYRVQYRNFVMLLTGDGEFATEQFLENHYSADFLRADVLKLGHHGSNDANSERFLRIVDPVVGLIPNAVSENPGVEHPFVLNRLRNLGVDYFASDRALPNRERAESGVRGDIQLFSDGESFTIVVENISFE